MTKPTSIKTSQLTVCACDDTSYWLTESGELICTVCHGIWIAPPPQADTDVICPSCYGTGRKDGDWCPHCDGKGDLW